jgi:hypothetical protein
MVTRGSLADETAAIVARATAPTVAKVVTAPKPYVAPSSLTATKPIPTATTVAKPKPYVAPSSLTATKPIPTATTVATPKPIPTDTTVATPKPYVARRTTTTPMAPKVVDSDVKATPVARPGSKGGGSASAPAGPPDSPGKAGERGEGKAHAYGNAGGRAWKSNKRGVRVATTGGKGGVKTRRSVTGPKVYKGAKTPPKAPA